MDLARLEVTQKARKVKAKSLQEEKLRLKSTALEKPFFPSDVVHRTNVRPDQTAGPNWSFHVVRDSLRMCDSVKKIKSKNCKIFRADKSNC